ncbi:hypothetical protein ABIA88_001408 [Bradyrhizobium sp. LA6.4]
MLSSRERGDAQRWEFRDLEERVNIDLDHSPA